jgi:hypothetical protein
VNYQNVKIAHPVCDPAPDSFGVKVIIKPVIDGDPFAFYGCRMGSKPCFYRYGAELKGVKSWAPAPAFDPGSFWVENDGRYTNDLRRKRIVIDSSDANAVRIDHAMAEQLNLTIRGGKPGKIGIIAVLQNGDVEPGARITWAKPERFDGRNGGYSPLAQTAEECNQ